MRAGGVALALLALAAICPFGWADTVLAKGLFSYEAPPGWQVGPQSNSAFDVSRTGNGGDFGSILVSIEESAKAMPDFVAARLHDFRERERLRIGAPKPFATTAGLDGFRVLATGPLVDGADKTPTAFVFFFFDGGANKKIAVRCACSKNREARYVPLFDAAVRSFTLE